MTESLTDPERSRLYIFVSVSEFDILGDICFNTRGLELSAHRTSVRRSVSQMKKRRCNVCKDSFMLLQ